MIAVITDSGASIPPDLAAAWGVEVVDQHVRRHDGEGDHGGAEPGRIPPAVGRAGGDEVVVLTVSARG